MSDKDKDLYILKKIIQYSREADETIQRFGDSIDTLKADKIYRNAAAMCILQIGELVGLLSEEITTKYTMIPWKQIRGMRNIAAHGYEEFDTDVLWETLKTDLPILLEYCTAIINAEGQSNDHSNT